MILAKEVIVITGCSGRTGTRVAHKFADPRFSVIGLDLVSPKIATTNFEFIRCDISSQTELQAAFKHIREKYGDHIASIIHLASFYKPEEGNWPSYEKVMGQGTLNLIENARTFHLEQLLYVSSLQVNAPCEPGQKINEYWPVEPISDYARSKLLAEDLLKKNHGQIPLVILRKAPTYDDGCHNSQLAQQIQRIYERLSISFFYPGNIAHGTAYLHLDDLADAIWLAVQRRFGLSKEITMIVSEPETVSYGELQKVIGLLCYGEECHTWSLPKWLAKSTVHAFKKMPFLPDLGVEDWMIDEVHGNYSCDISFIQEKLGWALKHTFRQTLPKMIASLKENPLAWYRENGLTLQSKKK